MRILKNEAIGLIIDMQERLYPHIHEHEILTKNTRILIEGLQALEIPIIITEQYTKGLGFTINPIKEVIPNFETLEKSAFSCCDDAPFSLELENSGRRKVIIAGIESHVCVLQTVIDLVEKAYTPVVVADCISSRSKENKKYALKRMRDEGAIITTYESILFELCRYSGNDFFKKISKLVK